MFVIGRLRQPGLTSLSPATLFFVLPNTTTSTELNNGSLLPPARLPKVTSLFLYLPFPAAFAVTFC